MSTLTNVTGVPPIAQKITEERPVEQTAPAAPAETAQRDPYTNPQIQVDPAQNAVILDFRDAAGKVVRQVPSPYELRSYQLSEQAGKTPGSGT